jgi:protoheme IX farnesyltransferase
LTFLTSAVYLLAYTPLKRVSPICTFVGAFPGAMPGVLGWAAARGRLDWGTLALFAILFLWQFPHFFAIAWIYREDYARGGIRMLPVVEPDGRSTSRRILLYSLLLAPVSVAPAFLGMSGRVYLVGAILLGAAFFYYGVRMMTLDRPVSDSGSRLRAKQLFRCSIAYLPLLLALMMSDAVRH